MKKSRKALPEQFKRLSTSSNREARTLIKRGSKAWNAWRKRNSRRLPDLSALDLHGIDLSGADLSYADLRDCNLQGANLRKSLLANVDLRGANLSNANLSQAQMYESSLNQCNFHKAELSNAIIFWSSLAGADLSQTRLIGTDFSGAEDMSSVNMTNAEMGWTILGDLDLSNVSGLETVSHEGPSVVGIDTIYRSSGNIPKSFLVGAGVPENFIEYIPSLIGTALAFASCFVSHSTKDKQFCDHLVSALRAAGIRVWYFPNDARWGEPLWGEIDQAIVHYDRLIVVCSRSSLQSRPVLRELERALVREDKSDNNIVFPIRIDDYVFSEWANPRKADLVNKVVGDFSDWDTDPRKFHRAIEKLMRSLRPSQSMISEIAAKGNDGQI